MYRNSSIGVVVPAYNEEGFVGDVIRDIPAFVDTIYVIDDRSTDGTWEEILAAARADKRRADRPSTDESENGEIEGQIVMDGGVTDPLEERAQVHEPIGRVVPIQHRTNQGAGGAIKTGYLAAFNDGIDVTVTVDGDGQMDLEQMPRLLDPIVDGEADYAKGNRLIHSNTETEMPSFRLFGNTILSLLTKIASGYWKLSDPQNGYTAISHHALETIDVEALYEYYGYCNDILVKLNTRQLCVADVSIPPRYGDERSNIRYPTYIRNVSAMLLRNFLWRLKTRYVIADFHPLALFYAIGTSAMFFGLSGCLWSIYVWKRRTNSLFVRATLSLLVFTVGSLFLVFAMLFDMQANENLEVLVYE